MEQEDIGGQILQIAQAIPKEYGTLKERKAMALKSLPKFRDYSITQKCKWLGVSRPFWYRLENRADFKENCAKYAKSLWGNYVFDILDAYVRKALAGDTAVMERILETVEALKPQAPKSSGNTQTVNLIQVKDKEAKRDEILSRFDIAVNHGNDTGDSVPDRD